MALEEELRKKYDFIMRPIKDLTKNWEIDVSHILEQYMGEIEKLSFTVNHDGAVINFAEASLLIQGTACVWGRKVEYLYTLIKKSLDMIGSKQSSPGQISLGPGNSTVEDGHFCDDEEKLIKLDDVSITSQRLMKGQYDPVTPFPLPPPSMLEVHSDEKGRVVIMEEKSDAVCYSNDFWVNHYVPFDDDVSVLDRDTNGALHRMHVATPSVSCESPSFDDVQPDEWDCEDQDPTESDKSMDISAPLVDDVFPEENQEILNTEINMRQRLRVPKTPVVQDEEVAKRLDPYEICVISSWTNKSHRKLKCYKPPRSKSQKRKHDGTQESAVEPISDFMDKFTKRNVDANEQNPLSLIMQVEQKSRNNIWKLIKSKALLSEQPIDNGIEHDYPESDEDCSVFGDNEEQIEHDFPGQAENIHPNDQAVLSYEDLVRQHVEKFYSGAQKFKEETELAQRVKRWEGVVSQHLEKQNQMPVFDIHTYGDKVLKKFTDVNETKAFTDICRSENRWDVCRLFSATLQLVNDQNFLISKSEDFQNSLNSMKLTLLTKHRLRDRFDNYAGET